MLVKQLEIRDRGTFIPVLAIEVSQNDGYLVSRAGFGQTPLIIIVNLVKMQCSYDPYGWQTMARTMPEAHHWIEAHWPEIENEQVIDVEYILGETPTVKASERLYV